LPVAFVKDRSYKSTSRTPRQPIAHGAFHYREGFKLLDGKRLPGGLMNPRRQLRSRSHAAPPPARRDSYPSFANRRLASGSDISIQHKPWWRTSASAAVYATLVSPAAAAWRPRNPKRHVRGTFMIYQKKVSSRVDGDEDRSDS